MHLLLNQLSISTYLATSGCRPAVSWGGGQFSFYGQTITNSDYHKCVIVKVYLLFIPAYYSKNVKIPRFSNSSIG